jgi:hypothetical protein
MKNGTLLVDKLVEIAKEAFKEEGSKFDELSFRKGVADCNNTSKLKNDHELRLKNKCKRNLNNRSANKVNDKRICHGQKDFE